MKIRFTEDYRACMDGVGFVYKNFAAGDVAEFDDVTAATFIAAGKAREEKELTKSPEVQVEKSEQPVEENKMVFAAPENKGKKKGKK